MARRKQPNHSSAFNAKVALAALKGEKTPAELGEQVDVHPNPIQDWKKRLVEEAENVFGGDAVEAQQTEREIEKLHAKVGQLTMENDFLSKYLGRYRLASADKRFTVLTSCRRRGAASCSMCPARRHTTGRSRSRSSTWS